ncbi:MULTISPECIES: dienelactone hydrolase family protein [Comamonas]|jgi:carboxymethylenebutenolidase|uniref:dienelactone hydrolase family protein n=1 Tax=Comamonas TaxID=283 RepID=UPI0025F19D7D|nr:MULTISPECIES: dienelactone hydrolase family protein [Comamonas]MDR3066540.1 dienelactone hydrolase family protein [Comamonas sp.]MEB5966594.1 dienelactone hydrolase family protein [Comamonas testosteroni]
MGSFVELTAVDGAKIPAYVAMPEGQARGAIVVLQEIFGVNSHIRSVADRYAAQGYVAVAPAMFARVKPDVELGYGEDDMKAGVALKTAVEALPAPGALRDVEAAVAHAATLVPGGKIGVVGFCWGGLMTWRSACNLASVSAAVCYYGGGMTGELEASRQALCPVLAHFGSKDHYISLESVEAFGKAQPKVEVHVYEADHGFNCDQRGSYNEAAAALAGERTLAFFAQHLG